jgi:hypothetical protein
VYRLTNLLAEKTPVCDTYVNEKVGIGAMEIGDANARGKGILSLESLIETFAKVDFYTHGLQDKDTHSNQALLGRIVFAIQGVEKDKNQEIMRPIRVNDKGPKSLVALQDFPEEHNHFRSP